MRIKIWASGDPESPGVGPYKMLDIIERDSSYTLGQSTPYGEVIVIPPPIPPFLDDVSQSVIVKLHPTSLTVIPENSAIVKATDPLNKIEFFPIRADTQGYLSDDPPLTGTYTVLASENLTIEDVSPLINSDTFAIWKRDCFVSKDTVRAFERVRYAIVHRYSTPRSGSVELDEKSNWLVNLVVACLSLIRPTKRSRAMHVPGIINANGTFEPHGFSFVEEPAEVPEIQKIFTIRKRDIDFLSVVLPEFIRLYEKDDEGRLKDEFEPLRMAVQLYEQAYAISYWKARHILWWSAIEALYGNAEEAVKARVYALFGNKNLVDGYRHPIYEPGDIPSCFTPLRDSIPTLGEMVPRLYEVRNASAHGQKVPDAHFVSTGHPLGETVGIDILAEAATLIIRKTITTILERRISDRFKDRGAREQFWLYEYGLNKKQSEKRLREMRDALGLP